MAVAPRLPIGQRVRSRRQELGLTQSGLAKSVGISGSYLNLIENDKRPIGGALQKRIAHRLGIDITSLTGERDAGLIQDLMEVSAALGLTDLDEQGAVRLVARDPRWADAFRALHRRYQDATETAVALSDRLSQDPKLVEMTHAVLSEITAIKSFAAIMRDGRGVGPDEADRFLEIIANQSELLGTHARTMIALLEGGPDAPSPATPRNEVDDFIIYRGNHFPVLEAAADRVGQRIERFSEDDDRGLRDALVEGWGVEIVREQIAPGQGDRTAREGAGSPDAAESNLFLDRAWPAATRRFRMARRLMALECRDIIEEQIVGARLSSEEARDMVRRALANYAAGALLGPYNRFLEAAERYRYDIDRLSFEFGMSFEQTAHRLVTLRREGSEGVPFAFLRADPAGNVSKPFGTPGLRMPRLGGACPLWVIYAAFSSPDQTLAQMAVMPQGERYLFVARRLAKRTDAYGAPRTVFSVMLGCDAVYADRVVYGDGFGSGSASVETPAGFSCSSCPRAACGQRASPFILG